MDKVRVAGLATIPSRIGILPFVLESLHDQVDIIEVAFNDYTHIPDYIEDFPKVIVSMTTNEMGDANKFYNVEHHKDAYYFSCDDDIVYPSDYTKTYIQAIKENDCLVTIHGSDIPDREIKSYYKGKKGRSHCLNTCKQTYVDIAGSGVSGFDTSMLKIDYNHFKKANMADIWLSMQCVEQGVKRLALEHKAGWIRGGLKKPFTIYEQHVNDDSIQTDLVNKFNWHDTR